jgi:hypothetical protein
LFKTYFDTTQLFLLIAGCVFFFISAIFQSRDKQITALLFLILCAISLFSFAALLDPFLNLWDERFHALVAKNLMHHPLKPTLYDEMWVYMPYDQWDRAHVWLHKQPLFLWQIALSFKLFGVSEFTLRLPSVVLASLLIPIFWRTGKLLVNTRVGYLAGVLFITTYYLLEIIAGRQELEHNDMSFLFYVSASIWAFTEYHYSGKRIWIFAIGAFAGCAIMCKWLVGLLIYLGWFAFKLLNNETKPWKWKDLFMSLATTIAVALPWQILIHLWYPTESKLESDYNFLHFTEPLEGHAGDMWYHLDKFNIIYGELASLLLIVGFIFLYRTMKNPKVFWAYVVMVVGIYLFFTLAATKMPSYTLSVAMIVFIAFATLLNYLIEEITSRIHRGWLKSLIIFTLIFFIGLFRLDPEKLQETHTPWKEENFYSRFLIHNKAIFTSLNLPENAILFNLKGVHYVDAMFYTNRPAYNIMPSSELCNELREKNFSIYVFEKEDSPLPAHILEDPEVHIIHEHIQGWE